MYSILRILDNMSNTQKILSKAQKVTCTQKQHSIGHTYHSTFLQHCHIYVQSIGLWVTYFLFFQYRYTITVVKLCLTKLSFTLLPV